MVGLMQSSILRAIALLLATVVGLLSLQGCGGQAGGAPSGIAGALTSASLKISSFGISVSGSQTVVNPSTTQTVLGIQGALFPTENSQSFRVTVEGAGANQNNVIYSFDIQPAAASPAPVKARGASRPASAYQGILLGTLQVAIATNPVDGNLYYYPVHSNDGGKTYVWNDATVTTPKTPGQIYQTTANVYESSQTAALRSGARDVIVEFYNTSATVAQSGDPISTADAPPAPTESQISFRSQHLTNVYVFTANIAPQNGIVDLSAGFAANNGDNGIVDSVKYKVQVDSVPQDAQSIVVQAFEQPTAGVTSPVVYRKVIDKGLAAPQSNLDPDSAWPASPANPNVTSLILMANRQRVLRIYASAYSGPDGSGQILGTTQEDGTSPTTGTYVNLSGTTGPLTYTTTVSPITTNTTAQTFPIEFIPEPNAYVPIPPGTTTVSPQNFVFEMQLANTLSGLELASYDTTLVSLATYAGEVSTSAYEVSGFATTNGSVTSSNSLKLQFQATETQYAQFAYDQVPIPSAPPVELVSIPIGLVTLVTSASTATEWPPAGSLTAISSSTPQNQLYYLVVSSFNSNPITSLSASTGIVSWASNNFSQQAYVDGSPPTYWRGAVNLFDASFNPGDGTSGIFTFAVPVAANQGGVGGGIIN
jgi:hypothetical protein